MGDSIIRNNRIFYCLLALLLMMLFFLYFYRLDMDSVKSWDESIYGVNGLEMLRSGELIMNTYGYKPDYFNLKPILWPQLVMVGFKNRRKVMVTVRTLRLQFIFFLKIFGIHSCIINV